MAVWNEEKKEVTFVHPATALLRVNRQIHTEAAAVLYSENTFRPRDMAEILDGLFLNDIRLPLDKAKLIRRIQIVSWCYRSCNCKGSRWDLGLTMVAVLPFFKGLRNIELQPQFQQYPSRMPYVDVIERHITMMLEGVQIVRRDCPTTNIVFMEPDITLLRRNYITFKEFFGRELPMLTAREANGSCMA
ncbi:hypothetical protein PG994_007252 [Apiospora phragmitis]|uniref:Uncharacterized protein n=1 Tax=Apiospora phragmitis TaxID=2905665 RepID=A0ABR1V0A4_9PEZI